MSAAAARMARRLLGRHVLFRLGALEVSAYLALLYLGCVAGIYAGAAEAVAAGLDGTRFALVAIALLVPALVGSRIWFVALNTRRFRGARGLVWRRRDGGSALAGGLLLAVGVSPLLLAAAQLPFRRFWDAGAVTMLVGLVFTRAGCSINGCCGGRLTESRLGVSLPDHTGVWRRRFPTQLLEAAWGSAILLAVVVCGPDRHAPGALFCWAMAAYALGRLALEPLRRTVAETAMLRANLATWGALAVLAVGVALVGTT